MEKKLSFSYKLLRFLGFNYSEEQYGNISIFTLLFQPFKNIYRSILWHMMDWAILEPINPRMFRAFLMRRMGAKVGKRCFIGDHVRVDLSHADLICLEDDVQIAGGTRFLCHQRDFSNYYRGDDYGKLPYVYKKIHIKKGALIGMESFILPGVTIGEGAVVGAGSLVTKDVPAWTVATGRPAKVVREIKERPQTDA